MAETLTTTTERAATEREYSVAQVAAATGMSRVRVCSWCRLGTIRARRLGQKLWLIPESAIEAIRNGRLPMSKE
jgi:predicted site-specific integrase-resolvase